MSTDEDGRTRLIAAAREELVERGVDGLSLRGIARRAGLSNAAPAYFFGDRAGMLTAIAVDGFRALTHALDAASSSSASPSTVAELGRAYVRFGLENAELFTLMFRPGALHADDPALKAASKAAIGVLGAAIPGPGGRASRDAPSPMALIGWALAHGLVTLARDGALQDATANGDPYALASDLLDVFSSTAVVD